MMLYSPYVRTNIAHSLVSGSNVDHMMTVTHPLVTDHLICNDHTPLLFIVNTDVVAKQQKLQIGSFTLSTRTTPSSP